MVPDTAPFFQSLEVCIQKYFCPTLIENAAHEINANYPELLSHSVGKGGLAICNPLDLAAYAHATSKATTRHLIVYLVDDERDFYHNSHWLTATLAGNASRNEHLEKEQSFLDLRWLGKPVVKRQDKQVCKAGLHFWVVPSTLNGTSLSTNE